jgi:hypothetical protein
MIIVPRGLLRALMFVAVDFRGARHAARLDGIDRNVEFARKHGLVLPEQETTLVEMLLNGAPIEDAIGELRATPCRSGGTLPEGAGAVEARAGPPRAADLGRGAVRPSPYGGR